MADQLGSLSRTHTCGALRASDVGAQVVLLGWIHRVRDLGGLLFLDVRDRHGLTQVLVPNDSPVMAVAKRLRSEFVVAVTGPVELRGADTVNPKLDTGEVEVLAQEIRLLNEAKTPPFPVADDTPVSEDVRLRYRYLDLRRPRLQFNLGLRHRVTMAIRRYFDAAGFWEIETPILTKSTPEGARDYLVPSRVHPGEFFALPQSPQIFKQILMVAGTDRYFQIVKCFRDEDLRADRQPEFTQVDVEISFAHVDLVFGLIEPLIVEIFKEIGVEVPTPFHAHRVRRGHVEVRIGQARPALRHGNRRRLARLGRRAVQRVPQHRRRTAASCARWWFRAPPATRARSSTRSSNRPSSSARWGSSGRARWTATSTPTSRPPARTSCSRRWPRPAAAIRISS